MFSNRERKRIAATAGTPIPFHKILWGPVVGSAVIAVTFVHPIDVVKTRRQIGGKYANLANIGVAADIGIHTNIVVNTDIDIDADIGVNADLDTDISDNPTSASTPTSTPTPTLTPTSVLSAA